MVRNTTTSKSSNNSLNNNSDSNYIIFYSLIWHNKSNFLTIFTNIFVHYVRSLYLYYNLQYDVWLVHKMFCLIRKTKIVVSSQERERENGGFVYDL